MSNRELTTETRTIHPRALEAVGEKDCIIMLGVAMDLRSGSIPPEKYNQVAFCGTACCIAGHCAYRLGRLSSYSITEWALHLIGKDNAISDLFSGLHPSDPQLAADAIERYVYGGADYPWTAPCFP